MKLLSVYTNLCFKLVFENNHRRPQLTLPVPLPPDAKSRSASGDARFTRGHLRQLNVHNFVTVGNRTHVDINFFDHKDVGSHLQ